MDKYKEIERSIIKRFRKEIWANFVKAVKEYELIKENDKVMVCISGGKDSFLMAKCFQELKRHSDFEFDVCYVVMNPGYNDFNKNNIIDNAKLLNVDIDMFKTDIFDIVSTVDGNPCYLCARMRRGCLYNRAKELGCNKIALGHHFDDVIETTLLSMFYGSEIKTMLPKLHSENFVGLELIRPMYLIREDDVKAWAKYNELTFINCACRFTEETSCEIDDNNTSKRKYIKKLIKELSGDNPNIAKNIMKSMDNINFNCILGGHKDGKRYSFLDNYDGEYDENNQD